MKSILHQEIIQSFLERYYTLGMSIDWFIKLFRVAFILANYKTFQNIIEEASSTADAIEEGSYYLLDKLNSAKSMVINSSN